MYQGFTVWFTGMSGAGKSTISHMLEARLLALGAQVEVLDGDVVRTRLSKGLGFGKQDRDENIRRIGFVCELLSRHGVIAIAAAISPYRAVRDEVRRRIANFVEVYVRMSRRSAGPARREGFVPEGAVGRDPAIHRHIGPIRAAGQPGSHREFGSGNPRTESGANLGYTGKTGPRIL